MGTGTVSILWILWIPCGFATFHLLLSSGFRKSSIPFVTSSCLPCYLQLIDSFHARINVKLYLVWFFPFGRLQLNDLAYVVWCRPLTPFCSPFSFQLSRVCVFQLIPKTFTKMSSSIGVFKLIPWVLDLAYVSSSLLFTFCAPIDFVTLSDYAISLCNPRELVFHFLRLNPPPAINFFALWQIARAFSSLHSHVNRSST